MSGTERDVAVGGQEASEAWSPGTLLVETTRRDQRSGREVVESRHAGHLAVVAGAGELVAGFGQYDRVTFARSAVKPFQAAGCLEVAAATGAERPTAEQVAVAWSSHRAEARHLEAVGSLLDRAGITAAELTCPAACGIAEPGAGASRLRHNCSGKHALFAWAGRQLGCEGEHLLDPDGPLQRRVLALIAEVVAVPAAVGVDGCGAPAVAVPLDALARGWLRLLQDPRFAAVRDAGWSHPGLVGGEGRLESALLAAGVLAKPGAEGVFAAAWMDRDGTPWAAALKIEDGASRAAPVAMAAVAERLGAVARLGWSPPPVLGGGVPRGQVRAAQSFLDGVGRLRTR